jgi:hypothetical protein
MNQLLENPWFLWLIGGSLLLGTAVWAYRHLRPHRKLLTAELTKYGHTFVSVETPPTFDIGPFPKVEGLRWLRRSATISGISGQWNTYRTVWYLDPGGEKRFS